MPTDPRVPTADEADRIVLATTFKATRFLVLPEAPLGTFGGLGDAAALPVRRDFEVVEILHGLIDACWDLATVDWPTTDTVIRVGFGVDPSEWPVDKVPDVTRAIAAARGWVTTYLTDNSQGLA